MATLSSAVPLGVSDPETSEDPSFKREVTGTCSSLHKRGPGTALSSSNRHELSTCLSGAHNEESVGKSRLPDHDADDTTSLATVKSAKCIRIAQGASNFALPDVEVDKMSKISIKRADPESSSDARILHLVNKSLPVKALPSSKTDDTVSHCPRKTNIPGKPCLKRRNTFIIQRPGSQQRNVTFERPVSVANVHENPEYSASPRSPRSPQLAFSNIHREHKTINGESLLAYDLEAINKSQETHETKEWAGSALKHGYSERHGLLPLSSDKRPHTGSPTSSPEYEGNSKSPENVKLQRRKSFHWEKVKNVITESNLPFPGAFIAHRDSLVQRGKQASGCRSAPPMVRTVGLGWKEPPPFETYVIRNARLVRRSSSAYRAWSAAIARGEIPNVDQYDVPKHDGEDCDTEQGQEYNTKADVAPSATLESNTAQFHHTQSANVDETLRINNNTNVIVHVNGEEVGRMVGDKQAGASEQDGAIVDKAENSEEVEPEDEGTPRSMQKDLRRLGFRDPDEANKKKTKPLKRDKAVVPKEKNVINLKEDPVLIQMSKKNRNVGKFTSPPEPRPHAVCFEIRGTSLTHKDVKFQIMKLVNMYPGIGIKTIQFHHRSLVNCEKEMDNRWIITTDSILARNRLAGSNLNFGGHEVQLRRYDDVVNTEYQQYVRMTNFVKMMNTRNILS